MTVEHAEPPESKRSDTLISIREAAALTNTTVVALIEAATLGHLELLVEHHVERQLVLRPFAPSLDKEVPGIPLQWQVPDYLVLDRHLCKSLRFKSSTYFGNATCGYRYEPGSSLEFKRLDAAEANNLVTDHGSVENVDVPKHVLGVNRWGRWRCWAFWLNGGFVQIPLHREDLYLRSMQLEHWMKPNPSEAAKDEYFFARTGEFNNVNRSGKKHLANDKKTAESQDANEFNDDFKSEQLLRMCEAAFELWAAKKVKPMDPHTHPTNYEVVTFLLKTNAFEKTAAENAAALIRPRWGRKAGRHQK